MQLGDLDNLEVLKLYVNQLTGEIPAELGGLANLEILFLWNSQLTGCITQPLRNVRANDFYSLDLPFCDVLLSRVTITPGSLTPTFDSYHPEYTVAVGRSRVTVATANDHNASIFLLDQNGVAIEDADGALEGHQVEFGPDLPTIRIRIVSEDGLAFHTYMIADLGAKYDVNKNGLIDRDEAIAAIVDYFKDVINRQEAIGVIRLYFST